MKVVKYEVQKGDSLGAIARAYSGNRGRWTEILQANPSLPRTKDNEGNTTIVPSYFRVGQVINLPYSWFERVGGRPGQAVNFPSAGLVQGPSGQVGLGDCTPSKVAPHPDAYYLVTSGKMPAQVAVDFNQIKDGHGDYGTLNAANNGWWQAGFSFNSYGDCVMNGWKDGIVIRVPQKWLDIPPTQLNSLPALAHLVKADGTTPWVPGTTTPGGGEPCPEGYVRDATTNLCVKGGGTKVSATDEGFKASSLLWLGLAVAAGVGAAIVLNNLIKAKKVHGAPPPALPAHTEEVVVRR